MSVSASQTPGTVSASRHFVPGIGNPEIRNIQIQQFSDSLTVCCCADCWLSTVTSVDADDDRADKIIF